MVHAAATPDLLPPDRAAPPPATAVPTATVRHRDTDDGTADLRAWLAQRQAANSYEVTRVPFAELDRWSFDRDTGNLRHDSGKFFTVEGLAVRTDYGAVPDWTQPIINQPEIGILGILVKRIDGTLHCLMQAKMEPGNINMIQLSPTVQATRSNLRRVHQGGAVPYLAYFGSGRPGRVLVDVLQSEQGAWFHSKRNRNMIVEVDGEVPDHPDFRWVELAQLTRLLAYDDLVNMDTRTVLACMPPDIGREPVPARSTFGTAVAASFAATGGLHSTTALLSWFTEMHLHRELDAHLVPLRDIAPWQRGAEEIARPDGRYFRIVGVNVSASNREVSQWAQPLLAPSAVGLIAFLSRDIGGVLHVLVHAKVEAGCRDVVEIAPAVACAPSSHTGGAEQPRYLDYVRGVPAHRVHFDAIQSDEGGRLFHARNRHLVIDTGDDLPIEVPPDHAWVTLGQLSTLMRRSYHVNIQARSMVACMYGLR